MPVSVFVPSAYRRDQKSSTRDRPPRHTQVLTAKECCAARLARITHKSSALIAQYFFERCVGRLPLALAQLELTRAAPGRRLLLAADLRENALHSVMRH